MDGKRRFYNGQNKRSREPVRVAAVHAAEVEALAPDTPRSKRGFHWVATWTDAESALGELPNAEAQVLVADASVFGSGLLDWLFRFKQVAPTTRILLRLEPSSASSIVRALMGGADGCICAAARSQCLLRAIRDLADGRAALCGVVAGELVHHFHELGCRNRRQSEALTGREAQVLDELVRGKMYKEIADTLRISLETVRTHVQRIYRKLGVRSRAELLLRQKSYAKPILFGVSQRQSRSSRPSRRRSSRRHTKM